MNSATIKFAEANLNRRRFAGGGLTASRPALNA